MCCDVCGTVDDCRIGCIVLCFAGYVVAVRLAEELAQEMHEHLDVVGLGL
jgi:hypothetical protein